MPTCGMFLIKEELGDAQGHVHKAKSAPVSPRLQTATYQLLHAFIDAIQKRNLSHRCMERTWLFLT